MRLVAIASRYVVIQGILATNRTMVFIFIQKTSYVSSSKDKDIKDLFDTKNRLTSVKWLFSTTLISLGSRITFISLLNRCILKAWRAFISSTSQSRYNYAYNYLISKHI